MDFKILDDDGMTVRCWVETKKRNISSAGLYKVNQHPGTVMIDKNKWDEGFRRAAEDGCPFLFAVQLEDGLFATCFATEPKNDPGITVGFGGRTRDTRDKNDIQDVVYIDFKFFVPIF